MERRRTIRLITERGLVSLGRRTAEVPRAGWPLRDISEGGLRFAMPEDHPKLPAAGEGVVVTIEVDDDKGDRKEGRPRKPLQLSAVVRRLKKGKRGEREVSLEFTGLSQDDRARLRGTVIDLAMEKIAQRGPAGTAKTPREPRSPRKAVLGDLGGTRLGDILVARSSISRDEIERFVSEDFEEGRPLGRQLVARGVVDERGVAKALAEQSGLAYADLDAEGVDLLKVRQFSEEYLMRYLFVPLEVARLRVKVAAASPLSEEVVGDIKRQYNRPVKVVIASERQVLSAIQKAFQIARNRRRSARVSAGLGVRFKVYDGSWKPLHGDVLVGLTKNISKGGVLFVGPEPGGARLAEEAARRFHVGLHLLLPDEPGPVRAPCELVRTTPVREAEEGRGRAALLLYGVRVLGLSDGDRDKLNRFRVSVYMRRAARVT